MGATRGGVGNNGVSGQGFAADFRKEVDAMNVIQCTGIVTTGMINVSFRRLRWAYLDGTIRNSRRCCRETSQRIQRLLRYATYLFNGLIIFSKVFNIQHSFQHTNVMPLR